MAIIHPYLSRKKKRKPTEAERKLRAEWDRIVASHAKPLELGSKAKGKIPGTSTRNMKCVPKVIPYHRETPDIPSLPMNGTATVPIIDPAAAEKHAMKRHAGIAFNKGGVMYLSDADLAEQRTGVHKRR